jgi:hypothetical protein
MEMKRKDIELRDWYAGLAMQQVFASSLDTFGNTDDFNEDVAELAFSMANAMMDKRAEIMDRE